MFMSTEFLVSPEGQKRSKKLRLRWAGPFEVKSVARNKLSAEIIFTDIQTKIHNVIPVNRLKLAHKSGEQSALSRSHLQPPEPEVFDDSEVSEEWNNKFLVGDGCVRGMNI